MYVMNNYQILSELDFKKFTLFLQELDFDTMIEFLMNN